MSGMGRSKPRADLISFELYSTSNLFYPRFDVNPNSGEPLWRISRWEIPVNTIHHDAAHPSHVTLPIIP